MSILKLAKKLKKSSRRSGLSLIEILLVLTLLGSVMAIIGNKVFKTFGRGKRKATLLQIGQIESWLDLYSIDCNRYPTTAQGLEALLTKPSVGPDCPNYDTQGYAEAKSGKIPVDQFGNPFNYECEDGQNYVITSFGADGKPGGEGPNADISTGEK